jgi:hypothetical protein
MQRLAAGLGVRDTLGRRCAQMRAAGICIFVMPAAPQNMARSAGRISCCLGQHLAGADADRAAWLICARGREFRSAASGSNIANEHHQRLPVRGQPPRARDPPLKSIGPGAARLGPGSWKADLDSKIVDSSVGGV